MADRSGRRPGWRWLWAGLAVLAALVIVARGFGSTAGDQDRRGDEVGSTIADVWAAVGVDEDVVQVFAYRDTFRRDHPRCAELDRDDRWYGEQGSSIPAGHVEQAEAEDAIVRFLESQGFAVERYRPVHPEATERVYWAERGEMVVHGTVSADGAVTVHVRSGPCARLVGAVDAERYQPATP